MRGRGGGGMDGGSVRLNTELFRRENLITGVGGGRGGLVFMAIDLFHLG